MDVAQSSEELSASEHEDRDRINRTVTVFGFTPDKVRFATSIERGQGKKHGLCLCLVRLFSFTVKGEGGRESSAIAMWS